MNAGSTFGRADREANRRKFTSFVSALVLATFSITLVLSTLMLIFVPIGTLGLSFDADVISHVDEGSPAADAGLRVGDRFTPETPFSVRERVGRSFRFQPAAYSFDVIRHGSTKHVTAKISRFNYDYDFTDIEIPFFIAEMLAFLTCALIGTFVVLIKPSRLTWLFFLFCIGAMMPVWGPSEVVSTLPFVPGLLLHLVRDALAVVGLFALLGFALLFPTEEARGWRERVLRVLPILAIGYLAWRYFERAAEFYPALFNYTYVDITVNALVALASVASVVGTYRSSAPEAKQRLKWIIFGITAGCAGLTYRTLLYYTGLFWYPEWLGWTAILVAFLAPLSLAYAILKGRVIDPRFIVNRAVVYLIVMALLAVVLASTYWLTGLFLQQARVAAIVQLLAAIAAGVLLHNLYRRLDSGINRLLFKRRYEAQEHLERLAAGLSRVESVQELETLITSEPVIVLDLVGSVLYRRNESGRYERTAAAQRTSVSTQLASGEPLVAWLQAHREPLGLSSGFLKRIGSALQDQPLALALPLCVDDALYAIVTYGPHENGTDLDPSEKVAIGSLQAPAESRYAALGLQSKKLRKLSELLLRSSESVYDDPLIYVANQLIDLIPERIRSAVVACAVIPGATCEDVMSVTDDPAGAELLQEFAKLAPVVYQREDATFAVHGIVSSIIQQRFPELCREILARCAQHTSERLNYRRAAQLFELAGMRAAAAQELEEHLTSCGRPFIGDGESTADAAAFDLEIVSRHPNLWINHSLSQLFREPIRASAREGRAVRERSRENGSVPDPLTSWCAYLHAEAGELEVASALLTSPFRADAASFATEFHASIAALVAGRLGRVNELEECIAAATPVASDECRALNALVRASTVHRARGHWNKERSELDVAINALGVRNSRLVVWAIAEGLVGAWLAGHERARRSYLDRLDAVIEECGAETFSHLAAVSKGDPRDSFGIEAPRWLAYAYLIATCNAQSWQEARTLSIRSLDAAIDAGEPFLQLLARIACAHFDDANRYDHFRHALDISNRIESGPLAAAVRRIVANDENAGMLEHFVMRLRQDRNTAGAALVVEMANGSVRRGSLVVSLSERELAVAFALARSSKTTSSAELSELIWPDLDESAGLRAVQTYVHRLRQRLGDPRAVENTQHGYRLRDDILVDLTEIESFMREVQTYEQFDELTALRIAAVAKHLESTRPGFVAGWEWFAPIERRIEEWSRNAKHLLANDALQRGAYDRALSLGQRMIACDELDESAWEIVLCSLVENGDRAGAQRELRRYREITLRELNAEPSAEVCRLVESVRPKSRRILRVVGN